MYDCIVLKVELYLEGILLEIYGGGVSFCLIRWLSVKTIDPYLYFELLKVIKNNQLLFMPYKSYLRKVIYKKFHAYKHHLLRY